MGRKVSEFRCLTDSDCSKKRVCHNRQCVTPWFMGPCKMPESGDDDPCKSDYHSCHGGRCTPFKTNSMKCFMWNSECPMDHWCDVFNGICVPKPDLLDFCEKDIGCRRPYVCSPYTGQCAPPCTTTQECVNSYGKMVDYSLICYSPSGDVQNNGYCENSKVLLDVQPSSSQISKLISHVVHFIMDDDDNAIDDGMDTSQEIIVDESISAEGSVHPIVSVIGDGYLPSGFNIVLILSIMGLIFYLYHYFITKKKRTALFSGSGHRFTRSGKGSGGSIEQRDILVSKLANVTSSMPIVDLSKENNNYDSSYSVRSAHEHSSLISKSSSDYSDRNSPPGYSESYKKY